MQLGVTPRMNTKRHGNHSKENGLHAQNMISILGSIIQHNWGGFCDLLMSMKGFQDGEE